jgi:hypothetical protein
MGFVLLLCTSGGFVLLTYPLDFVELQVGMDDFLMFQDRPLDCEADVDMHVVSQLREALRYVVGVHACWQGCLL